MFALLVSNLSFAQWTPILPELYEASPPHLSALTVRQRRRQYTAALAVSGAVMGGGVALGVNACSDLPVPVAPPDTQYSTGNCSFGMLLGGLGMIATGGTGVVLSSARHGAYAWRTADDHPDGSPTLGRASLAATGAGIVALVIAVGAEEERIAYTVSAPLIATGITLGYLQTAKNIRMLPSGESAEVSLLPVLSADHQGVQLRVRW